MDINAVKQRLGHSSAAFTLDTYGHVTPRMQRAVIDSLDRLVERNVGRMSAEDNQGVESRPCRARTCDTLIKRYKRFVPERNDK